MPSLETELRIIVQGFAEDQRLCLQAAVNGPHSGFDFQEFAKLLCSR